MPLIREKRLCIVSNHSYLPCLLSFKPQCGTRRQIGRFCSWNVSVYDVIDEYDVIYCFLGNRGVPGAEGTVYYCGWAGGQLDQPLILPTLMNMTSYILGNSGVQGTGLACPLSQYMTSLVNMTSIQATVVYQRAGNDVAVAGLACTRTLS